MDNQGATVRLQGCKVTVVPGMPKKSIERQLLLSCAYTDGTIVRHQAWQMVKSGVRPDIRRYPQFDGLQLQSSWLGKLTFK